MKMAEMSVGQHVTWLYKPRGGYGYLIPVDAEVVQIGKSRVRVRVRRVSGEFVVRSVRAEHLRERKAFYGKDA